MNKMNTIIENSTLYNYIEDLFLIFTELSIVNNSSNNNLEIYLCDLITVMEDPVINLFNSKNINIRNLIIEISTVNNIKFKYNNSSFYDSKINFELFLYLIDSFISIYYNIVNPSHNIMEDILNSNQNIINNNSLIKFDDTLNNIHIKERKYTKFNDNILFIIKNYCINLKCTYINYNRFFDFINDFNIIPNILSKYKANLIFYYLNFITCLKNNDDINSFITEFKLNKIDFNNITDFLYLCYTSSNNGNTFFEDMNDFFWLNPITGKFGNNKFIDLRTENYKKK